MRELESRLAALEAKVRGLDDLELRTAALEQAQWQHWGRPSGRWRSLWVKLWGLNELPVAGAAVSAAWPGGEATGQTDADGLASLVVRVPAGGPVDVAISIRKPPRWKPKTIDFVFSEQSVVDSLDSPINLYLAYDGLFDPSYIADGHHRNYTFADPTASGLVVEDPLHGDVALTNAGGASDSYWVSGAILLDHPGGGGCGAVDDVPASYRWPDAPVYGDTLRGFYRQVGGCPAAGGPTNDDVFSGSPAVESAEPQSWTVEFAADPWWGGAARTVRIREA